MTESLFEPPPHDGTVPGEAVAKDGISIDPSPLASGLAALRYCLPRAGAAAVNIYNVAGQSVMAQTLAVGRSGVVNLDMRRLSSGVYVVKFRSGDLVATKKLVVQRH